MSASGFTSLEHFRVQGVLDASVAELNRPELKPGQVVNVVAGKWNHRFGCAVGVKPTGGQAQTTVVNLNRVVLNPDDKAAVVSALENAATARKKW